MENIAASIRALAVPIAGLLEDPGNVRVHNQRNLAAIARSLLRFGQQRPIVLYPDGETVAAGNGTLVAARDLLGWESIAAVVSTLEGNEAAAYGIADNRSAELAKWDWEQLSDILKNIQSQPAAIDDLGFQAHELEPLLLAVWPSREPDPAGQPLRRIPIPESAWPVFARAFAVVNRRFGRDVPQGEALALIAQEWVTARE